MSARSSRAGSLTLYAIVLMLLLGFLISGMQVSVIDQHLSRQYAYFDLLARHGADSALEIGLRIADDSVPRTASYSVDVASPAKLVRLWINSTIGSGPNEIATLTGSVEVFDLHDRIVAYRRFENTVYVASRTFGNTWKRK